MTEAATQTTILSAPVAGRTETRHLRVGFIPLVDASVLIAAVEFGFAARHGLTLELVKDVSWANLRDRLAFQQFDVAHMLSPMPVASMLGLGSNPSPTITAFSLGQGGNAITLSIRLFQRMEETGLVAAQASALDNVRALARVLETMRERGEPMPTLGMTYPFSSHNYEFRYWLAAGGIDPDRDVKLVVVPPPLTSDALPQVPSMAFASARPGTWWRPSAVLAGSLLPSRISGHRPLKKCWACARIGRRKTRRLLTG